MWAGSSKYPTSSSYSVCEVTLLTLKSTFSIIHDVHYSDVTWALSRLKSSVSSLFVQQLVQSNNKETQKFRIAGPLLREYGVTGPSQGHVMRESVPWRDGNMSPCPQKTSYTYTHIVKSRIWAHRIPILKWFSFRLAAAFAQSIEARWWVANEDVVGAAPTGDAPTTSEWSASLLATKMYLILEV